MALEYKLRESEGEVECCDSCGSPAPTAEFDWGPPFTAKHDKTHRLLCEFCSTTMTSRYTEYPQHDQFGQMRAEVWRANAALFNALTFGLDSTRGVSPSDGKTQAGDAPSEAAANPRVAPSNDPTYFCNKCGYFGPVQVFHQRPNGSGKCDYMASLMEPSPAPCPSDVTSAGDAKEDQRG
jgi:hypothetical protein